MTDETEQPSVLTIRLADRASGDGGPHRFSTAERAELERTLAIEDEARFDAFCDSLEFAIGSFKLQRDMAKSGSTHKENRKALEQLRKTAECLEKELDRIPSGALTHLDLALQALNHEERRAAEWNESKDPGSTNQFRIPAMTGVTSETGSLLSRVAGGVSRIAAAIELIETNTRTKRGGRPVDAAPAILANRIARAFIEILDESPTSTVEGRYEQALRLALTAGEDSEAGFRDLHGLVQKTLQGIKPT